MVAKGFEAVMVADGNCAIASLDSVAPDVVITDIEMPNVDGLEFIRSLRSDERWRTVPVLLFTASAPGDPRLLTAAALAHVTVSG